MKTAAYAAQSARSPLLPYTIERRDPGPRDVALEIVYCGVCHSDLHAARGEWDGVPYPCVPSHEIVGRVTHVGSAVKRVVPGSMVAVGCMGAPATPHPSPAIFNLLLGRRSIAGSAIGGIAETQEMLDFCAARNIVSDIEMIAIQDIEKAYARLLKGTCAIASSSTCRP
jgi:D-arabinose 1-dehydrogenase-like Zn-dependent alcohol dehydrogenase